MSGSKIVEVNNLYFKYPTRLHKKKGLRDVFVDMGKGQWLSPKSNLDVKVVLDGISFQAEKGERIALIGRNGAGKSTLCRILARIYRSPRHNVKIQGSIRSVLDPNTIIFSDLTGRENAEILCQLLYGKSQRSTELLGEALEFSGLGTNLDTSIRTYSTGMKSRLLLSIAASWPTEVLILDEVYDGADIEFQKKIQSKMNSLIEKSTVTFLVSHSEERCRQLCNRGIVLEHGKILFDGPIDKAFDSYNGLFKS
jgi:ABC-type polysaccharide/polyol phosphate transport system ATPase subunit